MHRRIVRNEVYAHGILDHPNLVRNYSSWTENGFVYIQNEYCNGGSLREYTEKHVFTETEARTLLLQIAHGLWLVIISILGERGGIIVFKK